MRPIACKCFMESILHFPALIYLLQGDYNKMFGVGHLIKLKQGE